VPANRSRTGRWRDCLWQVYERAGALEISVDADRRGEPATGPDLVWRVRINSITDDAIHVEQPSAAGQVIPIQPGVRLIASMSIGQNRWMFHTRALPPRTPSRTPTLSLEMPTDVERCQRRNFYRTSTVELYLPKVECWPLLDPASAVAAEVANRAQVMESMRARTAESPALVPSAGETLVLPDVGPRFHGHLINLGGGGAGLLIDRADAAALDRTRFFWLRIDLRPQIALPLGVTGRAVHTHIDSSQNFYVGIAFDWSFNAGHRDFIVEQIADYLANIQHKQAAA
jgi:hypothetical protein